MKTPTRVIVIGASLGGSAAIRQVLKGLPPELPVPIVIVLHRGDSCDNYTELQLARASGLSVCEPDDKETIEPGRVYLAPGDYHLMVETDGSASLSKDAPANYSRPSIDVTMQSMAAVWGPSVIAIGLTCASRDGVAGLRAVQRAGGQTITQEPATAEAPELPNAAIEAGVADQILDLASIRDLLAQVETMPLRTSP